MKFYFEDWRGKNYITLEKGSAEWVNSDCPSIYNEKDIEILHNGGLNGFYGLPIEDISLLKQLRNFIIGSDKAFIKKYSQYYLFYLLRHIPGNLIKNFDRKLQKEVLQLVS